MKYSKFEVKAAILMAAIGNHPIVMPFGGRISNFRWISSNERAVPRKLGLGLPVETRSLMPYKAILCYTTRRNHRER